MKTVIRLVSSRISATAAFSSFCLAARLASADIVNAVWNSATDVPVTANGYTATGNTVNFSLNFAPATGTDLIVVNNTGLAFIVGTFDNLAQGQAVALSYSGITYRFVANYFGGSGNDLVLVWASDRAYAWGNNGNGQLGDNTTTIRHLPVAVTATGVLAGKTVVGLAAGGQHSLAVCSDGTAAAWGVNNLGELGDNGLSGYQSPVPAAVNTSPGVSALYGKTVVAVAGGLYNSLALCSDGTVAAWGNNHGGELGDNQASGQESAVPVAVNTSPGVSALYGKTVVGIAAGGDHSLALCSDGTVAGWGNNNVGQLGSAVASPSLVPVAVNTNLGVSALYGKTVVAIAAGDNHSLALCSDGTVVAWGGNGSGDLGIGNGTTTQTNAPVAVSTNSGVSALYGKTVVAIAAGGANFSLALCSDGTVAAWGNNSYGQLGDNTTSQRDTPVAVSTNQGVSALYGKTVVAIAAGDSHSLALCSDGTVASWGNNPTGQLGDNTTTQRNAPVAVDTMPLAANQRFTRVSSGPWAYHTLALVAAPPASPITLTGAAIATNGSFQFSFSNTPGAFFGVEACTNPALSLSDWTTLTGPTEVSPGQFQFSDPQATNTPQSFYRVRSP
jgi:alpha-tubulin suppressor-like RCC1 family protein